ncbi:MAG: DUF6518 family protein [Chloroflexota bacterium]
MTVAARVGLIAVVGLLVGVVTQIGQGLLPDGIGQVANSISPWLLVAFLLGSRMPDRGWAAGAGFGALAFALIGYYAMTQLRFGYGGSTGSLVLWAVAATVGGPVFGLAGWTWRVEDGWRRAAAIGLLAAVAIAEGCYLILILPEPAVGAGFVIVGLGVPLVLGRSIAERGRAYVTVVPALALGVVGYIAFLWLATLTSML